MRHTRLILLAAAIAQAQTDWPVYSLDSGARRFARIDQIRPENVARLAQAWSYDGTSTAPGNRASRTTPLIIGGVMYFATSAQTLVALEPETGREIWRFAHNYNPRPSRGLAYWAGNENAPPTIFFGTEDGLLIAVNARTGQKVPGFAKEGELDLKPGMKTDFPNALYGLNGAPIVYRNLVITGSHTQDNGFLGGKGDVRAWNAQTGELVWTFHTIPHPGEPGYETWLIPPVNSRAGANVWSTFSLDEETGTLFMPIGSPADDRYGGDRPGANLFGNSLVAVDALTGRLKWYFQTVHHDLWDYDLPPQPTLVDIRRNGQIIPALVQAGKTGLIFILDRRDGTPIYGVEERPVPKGDVPGEYYHPTQPFPLKPPPLARMTWNKNEIADFTPEHRAYCENLFKDARNDGPFAPVRTTPTVVFPGPDGGFNWGGGSYDPNLGYFFINSHDQGQVVRTAPTQRNAKGTAAQVPFYRQSVGAITNPATGWPCQPPPWGELFAIDVNTGDVAWRVPFGRVESLEKLGVMNTGSYNIGGSVATSSGLLFIGATSDKRFHAYESRTGRLLWETMLPDVGYANPVTYLGKDGKQYVAINANGNLVAFRLP
jgi:glucose dehydrogenase